LPKVFSVPHDLRCSCDICPLFCLCAVSCLLVCMYWLILASLEWNQFHLGSWSFLYVAEFTLQVLCWELLHLCLSKNWFIVLPFLVVLLSGLGMRIILAFENEFGSVPFLMFYRIVEEHWCSSLMIGSIISESIWSWTFLCWEIIYYCFNFIAWYRFV
jgi:hypothetical protein